MPPTAYATYADGPPAFMDLGEILDLLNADRLRAGLPKRDRWWARRVVEAMGVRLVQRGPRCKLIALGADLRRSGFWDALQHHRQRVQDDAEDEDGPDAQPARSLRSIDARSR